MNKIYFKGIVRNSKVNGHHLDVIKLNNGSNIIHFGAHGKSVIVEKTIQNKLIYYKKEIKEKKTVIKIFKFD